METLTLETLPKAFVSLTNEVSEIKRLLLEKSNEQPTETDRWFDLNELCIYYPDKFWKPRMNAGIVLAEKGGKKLMFLKSEIDNLLGQVRKTKKIGLKKVESMQVQTIQSRIYEARGQKVMLDFDLAELYEVPTKALNQAIKRNEKRFPIDFMFRLTESEWETMRSQIVTTSQKKRNISAMPYVFTEQGLAMLSGILNSDKAIEVNIAIMRAFVFIRQYALSHKDLSDKLKELEIRYNKRFKDISEALNYLLRKDHNVETFKKRKQIGFKSGGK
jgi:hypothetical protein